MKVGIQLAELRAEGRREVVLLLASDNKSREFREKLAAFV
ncbi:MAG: hypothetical protein RLZZ480_550 [Candidatus Parcubacteria bacterium]|jgi:hypothetical protein